MTSPADLPKVDRMLAWPTVAAALAEHPRPLVLSALRSTLDAARGLLLRNEPVALDQAALTAQFCSALARLTTASLRKVINGTGIVIHTNLGRAPLSRMLAPLLEDAAFGCSTLEYDVATGGRGSRLAHVEGLLCDLTGAEAAMAVNNNAAAVLLVLTGLCTGREGIVSRGELVEIGGGFRIPDVMRQSGALLREVGTTNRTRLDDYRQAMGPDTGLLLKVHASNFAMVGFTAEASVAELANLGRGQGVPLLVDAGSGSLIDLSRFGIVGEPAIREFVQAGADVITFSGDKLLGGPQAGLIVGRKEFIEPLRRHPLLRALRLDKLTLAALEGTLRLCRDERQALAEIPVLRMLTATPDEVRRRGQRFLRRLRPRLPVGVALALTAGVSQPGGGSYPLLELPTTLLAVTCDGCSAGEIGRRLRGGAVPVIGRIAADRFLLDVRTIPDEDLPHLAVALSRLS